MAWVLAVPVLSYAALLTAGAAPAAIVVLVVLHTGVGLMLIAGLRRSVETAAAGPAPGTPQHSIFG